MRDDTRLLNGDINVTPFLDVLLVLIITFMAAMTTRKTMDVQLHAARRVRGPTGQDSPRASRRTLPERAHGDGHCEVGWRDGPLAAAE